MIDNPLTLIQSVNYLSEINKEIKTVNIWKNCKTNLKQHARNFSMGTIYFASITY